MKPPPTPPPVPTHWVDFDSLVEGMRTKGLPRWIDLEYDSATYPIRLETRRVRALLASILPRRAKFGKVEASVGRQQCDIVLTLRWHTPSHRGWVQFLDQTGNGRATSTPGGTVRVKATKLALCQPRKEVDSCEEVERFYVPDAVARGSTETSSAEPAGGRVRCTPSEWVDPCQSRAPAPFRCVSLPLIVPPGLCT